MRVYAVVSEQTSDEALYLFVDRQMAERMVESWNRDEPDRVGELHVEPVELEISADLGAPPFASPRLGPHKPTPFANPLVASAERPNDPLRELLLLFHGKIFRREEAADVVDNDGCEETFSGISLECASESCKRIRILDLRTC